MKYEREDRAEARDYRKPGGPWCPVIVIEHKGDYPLVRFHDAKRLYVMPDDIRPRREAEPSAT